MSQPTERTEQMRDGEFAVTLDGPPRAVAPPLLRALAGGLGAVCLVAGWLAVVPGFIVLFLLVIVSGLALTDDSGPSEVAPLWSEYGRPALWAVGIGLVVLRLGIVLVRGRRRLVLFLRRFGDGEATHAATVATERVGRSWRLITLDDASIASVGVGGVSRTFLGAAGVFEALQPMAKAAGRVLAGLFKFVIIGAAWGAGGAAALTAVTTDGDFAQRFLTVISLLDLTDDVGGTPGDIFRICAFLVLGCGALFLAWSALSLGFAIFVLPFLSFVVMLRGAIGEAEWAKNMEIADVADIVRARSTVRSIGRRIFSPRLMVMTVDSDVWQLAVGGLAAVSAVALIDVSEPSENVLWEVEQMTRRFGPRCVFVGDYDRVIELAGPAVAGSTVSRLKHLLDGQKVLAYTNDDAGVASFARALRATFERAVRLPVPVPRPPDPITRQMMSQAMRQMRQYARAQARAARRSR